MVSSKYKKQAQNQKKQDKYNQIINKLNIEEIHVENNYNQYKSQPHMEEEQVGNEKTRDFICACGKNYLSYAALFTHIKQKHDGKAPGPIVRPRSERKRGRPRKNPLNDQDLRNSDSDAGKNGIPFTNEINNNNINIIQKKTKQAAQILGCGQFQAFQAYRPQVSYSRKIKNEKQLKQLMKQTTLKKCISNNQKHLQRLVKEDCSSSHESHLQLKHSKSAPPENRVDDQYSQYQQNFVINHLKTIFENYEPSDQQYSCSQIIQIFDWLGQQINENSKIKLTNYNTNSKISIQKGFQAYLLQIKDYLEEFQWKQISFLLSLFYEFIAHQIGKPSNIMLLGLQVSQFTKFITTFLHNYLPGKVKQLSVSELHIFNSTNPSNIILSLYNWVALREMNNQSIRSKIQDSKIQQAINNLELNNNIQRFNQYLNPAQKQQQLINNKERSSSSQDLKFQQINDILQKARSARQINLKESLNMYENLPEPVINQKIIQQQNNLQNSEQLLQQSQQSIQEQISQSSKSLNQKKGHQTDNAILSQR